MLAAIKIQIIKFYSGMVSVKHHYKVGNVPLILMTYESASFLVSALFSEFIGWCIGRCQVFVSLSFYSPSSIKGIVRLSNSSTDLLEPAFCSFISSKCVGIYCNS